MPRLNTTQKKLINGLVKQHASNAIVRRQVNRAIVGGKKIVRRNLTPALAGLGNMVYGARGSKMGEALGRAITGHGDYRIHKHAMEHDGGRMGYKNSKVHLEKGEMLIEHSEYIGELVSDGTATSKFLSQAYGINAGNSGTFPFLSALAANFQMYSFDKLVFEFRSLSSESAGASTVVPMGSITLATQYDSSLGTYANKSQMDNSDFAISCKPSDSAKMAVECKSNFNVLGNYYVNGGSATSNSGVSNADIRMQNIGIFQIASTGIPTGGSALDLGEIWCHYSCRLMKSTIVGQFNNLNSAHYQITAGSSTYALGTAQVSKGDYIGLGFVTPTTCNAFTFPLAVTQGSYLIALTYNGSSTVSCSGPTVAVTNGSLLSIWESDAGAYINIPSAGNLETATRVATLAVVSVNAPGSALCTVTYTPSTVPTTPTVDLVVTPLNAQIIA